MMVLLSIFIFIVLIYYSYKYAWWGKPVSYKHPRILMYHMICEHQQNAKFNGLRVTPKNFEKQVAYLAKHQWTFVTMSELIEHKDRLPYKTVAITFDDGYADNYFNALPILIKYNAKATIYLVVDRHNREWSSKRKSNHSNNELMYEPKLQNDQVKNLLMSGLIEIGSHTMTHDNLKHLAQKQKLYEIFESKATLEKQLGIKCRSFCYPFGIYGKEDIALVSQAGYTNATTTLKGIDTSNYSNPYELKRITINGKDTFLAFRLKLTRGLKGVLK